MTESPAGLAWLSAFDAEVRRALPLSTPARNLLCAHAALECGWGTSFAFRKGLNAFSITAGPHWHGAVVAGGDLEYVAGAKPTAKPRAITQLWRVYPTVGAAIEDAWAFLGWPRYKPARDALERGEAAEYVARLHDGGYFTLPSAQYYIGIDSCLRRVVAALTPPDPAVTPPAV
jgi:hypothetical protein